MDSVTFIVLTITIIIFIAAFGGAAIGMYHERHR